MTRVRGLVVNPYNGHGTYAVGPRFVGRKDESADLFEFVSDGQGSRALVGVPGIGKSSLARSVFDRISASAKIRSYWLDVSGVDTGRSLTEELLTAVGGVGGNDANLALKRSLSDQRRDGWKTVVFLDSFDAIRRTREPALALYRLREMIADPSRYGLALVLICRRELSILEERIQELSILANNCPCIWLRPFDVEDVAAMAARGFVHPLADVELRRIVEETGGYPLLVEQALQRAYARGVLSWSIDLADDRDAMATRLLDFVDAIGCRDMIREIVTGAENRMGPTEQQFSARDMLVRYGLVSTIGDSWTVPFRALRGAIPPLPVDRLRLA